MLMPSCSVISPDLDRLARLRQEIRAVEGFGQTVEVLPIGLAAIDAALPGGGLPMRGWHAVHGGAGAATAFAAWLAGRLSAQRGLPALWVTRGPIELYTLGLARYGVGTGQLVVARAETMAERLWAVEEGLKSRQLAAVIGEVGALAPAVGRRLQLAATASGVAGIALRPLWPGEAPPMAQEAALTRWHVGTAAPSVMERGEAEGGFGTPVWDLVLERARGGRPGAWRVEWRDATRDLCLVAAFLDRADPGPPLSAERARGGARDVA